MTKKLYILNITLMHFHVLNVVRKSKIMYEKMNGKILGKKIKKVYSMNTKLLFYA